MGFRLARRFLCSTASGRVLPALLCATVATMAGNAFAELSIPAFTAYIDPNPSGAKVSEKNGGISNWNDPAQKVLWFGKLKKPGKLECRVLLKSPMGATSKWRLSVGDQKHEATVTGKGDDAVTVDFGAFKIAKPGYTKFALESLNDKGQSAGELKTLILNGPAAQEAHFNLKERRNASSVHLNYPIPKEAKVAAFYCEATAVEDPVFTYYEVCGWHRGYFGMQVNSEKERRIIFSVWDSGGEAVDRGKVKDTDRAKLVAKGDGVNSGDFGNEGTGGHSHLVYDWKTGEVQRFYVTAQPADATHTVFSGYYFRPDKKEWMLISSWNAPKDGGWLHGLYSFSENFGGSNGHLRRKALYGNQWLKTSDDKWQEITTASFSHDPTGKTDRLDRFMGVEKGQFFLSNGGFIEGSTPSGEKFTRPPLKRAPSDIVLPKVSAEK